MDKKDKYFFSSVGPILIFAYVPSATGSLLRITETLGRSLVLFIWCGLSGIVLIVLFFTSMMHTIFKLAKDPSGLRSKGKRGLRWSYFNLIFIKHTSYSRIIGKHQTRISSGQLVLLIFFPKEKKISVSEVLFPYKWGGWVSLRATIHCYSHCVHRKAGCGRHWYLIPTLSRVFALTKLPFAIAVYLWE